MTVTSRTDLYVPEITTDAVRGTLKGKNGLMGSVFVSSGAVTVSGTMPARGRRAIGSTIRMPYWGMLPDFETLTESDSATPQKVAMTYEDATVARKSLAFELSTWAAGAADASGYGDVNSYLAAAASASAVRAMDSAMIAAGATSPLIASIYSATVPDYLTWQDVLQQKAIKLGDENMNIVGMVCHSLVAADLASQTDSNGRPILSDPKIGEVQTVAGVPVVISDRIPLTGSTMGTMVGPYTSATNTTPGSGAATFTIAVTDVTVFGPWQLVIETITTGALGTATIRFSTDAGNTWSAAIATAASGNATSLVDTAADSLVGNNGKTGVSVTFTTAGGTDMTDGDFYRSTANVCCESQIWLPGAGAFWYDEDALGLKEDSDILEDTTLGAMHLYYAAHVYRRRATGSRPGVLRLRSNVRSFVG
jgi:hypothetical protein